MMDIQKIEQLMEEIRRAYKVLRAESAELQNLMDITFWFEDGYITDNEFGFLKNQNKQIYNMLTNM